MTDKKESLSQDMLIADALLRLKAIENLLVAKGIFTKDEFYAEMETITRQVAKDLLSKLNVPGDLDEILDEISKSTSEN